MADDTDETVLFAGFVLLQQLQNKKIGAPRATPYRPPIAYERLAVWSIEGAGWGDNECRAYLRFTKGEIMELITYLRLEEWSDQPHKNRYACSPEQALCMLLYRHASPVRLVDMIQVCQITSTVVYEYLN